MPIETRVDGDPASCRALAQQVRAGGRAATAAGDDVVGARTDSTTCWGGEAADAFRDRMGELAQGSDQLAEYSVQVAQAAEVFADELGTVQSRMQQARSVAAGAGLPVSGTVIGEPAPAPAPLAPAGATPEQVTAHGQAVQVHAAQAQAYTEVQATVARAREIETRAHQNLGTALGRQASFAQYNLSNAGWTAWAFASGGAGALHGAFAKWHRLAADRGALAGRWGGIAAHPTFPAAFRESAARYAGQLGLGAAEAQRHADSAARALGNIGRTTAGATALSWFAGAPGARLAEARPRFERLPSGSVVASRPALQPLAKITSKVPYIGIGTTALQVGHAVHSGKPVGTAVASGVSSLVVGAAGQSVAMSLLMAGGMAAGPAGWIAVGAGTALAVGVGYVVENYGDEIADAAGDAWDATVGKVF